MSAYSSAFTATSMSLEQQLELSKRRHEAYKTLISQVADQLREEDMKNIFWQMSTPPKLRTESALNVLEDLERLDTFSERNVHRLSKLLKNINRIDLMNKVDDYNQQYRYGNYSYSMLN